VNSVRRIPPWNVGGCWMDRIHSRFSRSPVVFSSLFTTIYTCLRGAVTRHPGLTTVQQAYRRQLSYRRIPLNTYRFCLLPNSGPPNLPSYINLSSFSPPPTGARADLKRVYLSRLAPPDRERHYMRPPTVRAARRDDGGTRGDRTRLTKRTRWLGGYILENRQPAWLPAATHYTLPAQLLATIALSYMW